MKKEREFLNELYQSNANSLPFLKHFQDDKYLRYKLFCEYLKTELKPNLNLFINKYLTSKEIQKGYEESINKIPPSKVKDRNIVVAANFYPVSDIEKKIKEIEIEFHKKIQKGDIDKKNYCHHLRDTEIVKQLTLLFKEFQDFEELVLNKNNYNALSYAESFAQNVINKLESFKLPKLTKSILNEFINNSENNTLTVTIALKRNQPSSRKEDGFSPKEVSRNYRELKRYADNHFNNYLKELKAKERNLFKKFSHIGYLDFQRLNQELKNLKTTTHKLDYLKSIKEKYYDKHKEVVNNFDSNEHLFYIVNGTTFYENIFGNYNLITPLSIQEPVYNKNFSNSTNDPEFTYWFLKYNAEKVFNHTINSKEFKDKINSKLKETLLNADLKELTEFETKAKELLLNKKIDIYTNNYTHSKEIALLRVLDGKYYKENTIPIISGWGSDEVQLYFKHILLKPHLERLLKSKITNKKKTNQELLDKNFIENIRLQFSTTNFGFIDKNNESIVIPKKLTHDYLMRNFEISDSILKHYFLPTNDMISDEEYQNMVKGGYGGKKEKTLHPYSIIIFGAYFSRKAMYYRLMSLFYDNTGINLNGNPINTFTDLAPYFKDYAKGFENGFINFKKDCIEPFLIGYSDKNDFTNKVFEYLTKRIFFKHDWFNNHAGFTINGISEKNNIINASEDGLHQGYFYKAWSIVFSNNQLFKSLFDNYFEENKTKQELRTKNIIAHELLGENKTHDSSIVFHHIAEILKKHSITILDARQILLDMKGSFSPEQIEFIVEPIITYLERSKNNTPENRKSTKKAFHKPQQYLKNLFKNDGQYYNDIIDSLIENDFITKNEDETFNWKGAKEDKSLAHKTLICTFALVLDDKDYLEPNLSNTSIAKALTNTFKNITITGKTYGETRSNFLSKPHYSRPFFFIN